MKANERLAIKILQSDEFKDNPPVLLDIGASDEIHNKEWKILAPYSILVAFDADEREVDYLDNIKSNFLKKIVVKKVVSAGNKNRQKFYLTKSPVCSSSLMPDMSSLKNWQFWARFEVEKETELPAISMSKILKKLKISKIDWFKTDSQGTDLRLFKSLRKLMYRVLAVDFEPGIIDAYKGEDKLWHVIRDMEHLPFWMSDCIVKGSKRIPQEISKRYLNSTFPLSNLVRSPCWAEIGYLNNGDKKYLREKRDYMMLIVIALLKKQYGHALFISDLGGLDEISQKIAKIITQKSIVTRIRNIMPF